MKTADTEQKRIEISDPALIGKYPNDRVTYTGAAAVKMRSDLEARKTKYMDEIFQAKDYLRYLRMCDQSNRLEGFLTVQDFLSNKDYWKSLADCWQQTECTYPNTQIWLELFQSTRSQKRFLMTAGERKQFSSLPEKVVVYRGTNTKQDSGCSWTHAKKIAQFFAVYSNGPRRAYFGNAPLTKNQFVITGECEKADIIALMNGRNEGEVIIDFAKVSNKRFEPVTAQN